MPGWLQAQQTKDGKTVWYARWREGGRRRKKRIGTVSRRDAERALQVIGRDIELAPFGLVRRERLSLEQFVRDRWLPRRTNVRANTLLRDQTVLRAHILPRLGRYNLDEITTESVEDLVAAVKRARSAGTAKRTYAVLRRALEDARRWNLILANPAVDVAVEVPRLRPRPLALSDLQSVLAAAPSTWQPLILTAALTGLRWGELAALEWQDVDLEIDVVRVERQVPANLLGQVGEPKSNAGLRLVDLLPPVRQLLLGRPRVGNLVFPGARGGYLNYRWFMQHVWKRAVTGAGVRLRFHDLRHVFASLLIGLGHDAVYVSSQLGHSSTSVTLEVYTHLFAEQRKGRRLDRDEVFGSLRETCPSG